MIYLYIGNIYTHAKEGEKCQYQRLNLDQLKIKKGREIKTDNGEKREAIQG